MDIYNKYALRVGISIIIFVSLLKECKNIILKLLPIISKLYVIVDNSRTQNLSL